MIHKPIQIKNLELSFSHKICFENFNCHIAYGSRIAIIGRNGSGKSTLLKMIAGICTPSQGSIYVGDDVVIGYVPQVIQEYAEASGGQRLNQALTQALSKDPNLLLLDEPTNHLDVRNRKKLMHLLQSFTGTLIVVSHDTELLRNCIDSVWHIDNQKVHVFSGNYDDYINDIASKRTSIEKEVVRLGKQKKNMHEKLMQEQQRAAKSSVQGKKSIEQRKWSKVVGQTKASSAQESSGRKKVSIDKRKSQLTDALEELYLSEIIVPTFSIDSDETNNRTLVQVSHGSVGYSEIKPLLSNINLIVSSKDRIALVGDNGSGKSTLVKAILGDKTACVSGEWLYTVKKDDIGYLDQHYSTLDPGKTVLEAIADLVPDWSHAEIRRHLNDFLFRKNEEVSAPVSTLSGGEKARLSLAQIAAQTPKLLILDEITNNLDLETKEHIIQVLKAYPGAMIIISHDDDFLEAVGVTTVVDVQRFKNDVTSNNTKV